MVCRLALILTLLLSSASAQDLGSIAGTVLDARRVPIPGATIRLFTKEAGPPPETLTELDGTFVFPNLPPGRYRVVVEMTAFRSVTLDDLDPSAAAARSLAVTLERSETRGRPAPPLTAARAEQRTPPVTARVEPETASPDAGRRNPPAAGPARTRSEQPPAGGAPRRGRAGAGAGEAAGADPGGAFQEIGVAGIGANAATDPLAATAAGDASRPDNSDVLLISGNTPASIDSGDWSDARFRERMMEMASRMGFGIGEGQGPGGPGGERGGFGRFEGMGGGGFGGGFGPPGGGFGGGGGPGGGAGGGFGGFAGRGRGGRQPRLNGSLSSTYRNSALNARPYSITGAELAQPLQIGDNFSASLGGPMPWGAKVQAPAGRGPRAAIPQQPGMWFFSYEGSRNRDPYEVLTTVPTLLERSGDFSQTSLRSGALAGKSLVLFDPAAPGAEFAGGRIPASRMDPAALALLAYIPLPNLPGAVQNYSQRRGLPGSSNSFSGRVTTRLSRRDNINVSYSLRTGDSLSSQAFPGLDTTRTNRSQNATVGGIHRFQARTILNYRVSLNRVRTLSSNPFAFTTDLAGQLGIQGVSREPINYGIPTINFTNYGDLQLGSPALTRNQTLTVGAGLNRFFSRHSIQAGGDASWNQRNSRVDPNARGRFDFSGFATSAFDGAGRPVGGTGYDFADFLLGLPYATSRRFGSSNNYLRNRTLNLFVQDNWRVRSNFTVNVGLRYEYIQPFYEKYDRLVGLDVAPGFAAVAQVFPDKTGPYSGSFPRSLLFSDRNNLGPRIGIAWKRTPTSKWVWRAGYGLFYNPSVYPYISGQLVGQPPFAVSQDILTTVETPLTLRNGFPVDPNVTILNTYAIDAHYRIGYVQQWNLNLQTQLARLYTLEVGYNASKGTRLDILRAPNRAPSGAAPGSTEDNRTISNAGNFVYQQSGANSVLHSLRVRVNRRFSRGFRIENGYTFGRSLDNASGIGGGGLVVVQDERNVRAERALSSFDQRHRFESEFNFDMPVGARRRFLGSAPALVDKLVGGWSLNGSFNLSSGTPLTPRILGNVSNNSGTGSNASERADWTGASISLPGDERTTTRYFNTLAFVLPQPGRFGNASRNIIPGPGSSLLNLSLRKGFRLDDGNRRLEVRWQVTNVLNHPNFGGIGTVVNALNFGRVTSVRSMRQMEFQLRVNF